METRSIIVGKEEIPLGHNAKALLFSGATDSDGRLYYASPIEKIIKDFNLNCRSLEFISAYIEN
jgi:hypothetical protein